MTGGEDQLLASQLAALGITVAAADLRRLLQLRDELLRWNRRINLTAIREPGEALEKHLVDSLTLCPLLGGKERLLDIGSGAGFPGLALHLARPGLRVVSVEAIQKKIAFQRHAARCLGAEGFEARQARAEDLARDPGLAAGFEVVVSRALGSLADFARLARPFLAPGGRAVAMKGAEGPAEGTAAGRDLARLGLHCVEIRELRLPQSGARRSLIILAPDSPQDLGS